MNREIKFRFWLTDDKQMLDVDQLTLADNCTRFGSGILDKHNDAHSFADGVLMQFTGLRDKSGVEIYEGDVLYGRYLVCNVQVVWDCALASFELEGCGGSEHLLDLSGENDLGYNPWQVIGNVFENPELLEAK